MVTRALNIRFLSSLSDIALGSTFLKNVWGGVDDVVPVDVAVASGHVGGYFAGAFESDRLVAASYGFLGSMNGSPTLHSHVTASIAPGAGYALKLHQKTWAAENGLTAITWTFDPLVRRNCFFNFAKLGAVATEYLENFYGEMHDDLNRGEQSDRLFAVLALGERQTPPDVSGLAIPSALSVRDGAPALAGDVAEMISQRQRFAVELPEDIEGLRETNPTAAAQWRLVVRSTLSDAFQSGAVIARMIENRALVIEWPESSKL